MNKLSGGSVTRIRICRTRKRKVFSLRQTTTFVDSRAHKLLALCFTAGANWKLGLFIDAEEGVSDGHDGFLTAVLRLIQ